MVIGAVFLVLMAEYGVAPLDRTPNRPYVREREIPEVYVWLAGLPGQFALVELPLADAFEESRRMYYSLQHWQKRVNGHSGHDSPFLRRLAEAKVDELSAKALNMLRRQGVKLLVIHEDEYQDRPIDDFIVRAEGAGDIKRLKSFGRTKVYTLSRAAPAAGG